MSRRPPPSANPRCRWRASPRQARRPRRPPPAARHPGFGTARALPRRHPRRPPPAMVPHAVHGGHPGGGFSPTVRDSTVRQGAARRRGSSAAAASAAALSAAERRKRRRKKGSEIKDRGYADEYMDYDEDPRRANRARKPRRHGLDTGRGPDGLHRRGRRGRTPIRPPGSDAELTGDSFGTGRPTPCCRAPESRRSVGAGGGSTR